MAGRSVGGERPWRAPARGAPRTTAVALLAALCACATPPVALPPGAAPPPALPPTGPAPPEAQAPAPGGIAPEVLRELAAEPELAPHTARLAAAAGDERPRLLLARARASVDAAQRLLRARTPGFQSLFPPDELRFVAHYELARRDCGEILAAFPAAPEAAEAQYTLGLVHDYPHLAHFEQAIEAYRAAVERYPGTEAAARAAERLRVIEEHFAPAVPAAP